VKLIFLDGFSDANAAETICGKPIAAIVPTDAVLKKLRRLGLKILFINGSIDLILDFRIY
jgi:hypothetical protein